MKKKELMYQELSEYYDLIYNNKKDYKKESNEIIKLIEKYKISNGNKLLELGCGSGNHLIYLSKKYDCLGTDLNQEILDVAKNKLKTVKFKQANMIDFNLNQKYDIILSLFSAIGYVKTKSNLKKTIQNISKHINNGGLIIIEGWFENKEFRDKRIFMDTYSDENFCISRITNTRKKGNISELEFNWTIAKLGEKVNFFKEKHELGLFENNYIVELFEKNNVKVKVLKNHKDFRTLFIGIKQ